MYTEETMPTFTPDFGGYVPTEAKDKLQDMTRFLKIMGNWGEFGGYFGLGLSGSLVVRAIPVLIPSAVILTPAIGLALIISAFNGNCDRSQLILLALSTAIISGNWDAWTAWLFFNAATLTTIAIALILTGGAVVYLISNRSQK
jgi:hypothetical protein